MFACLRGHLDIAIALMGNGANSQIKNMVSKFSLMLVIDTNKSFQQEGMTASDVASVNEFPDLCAVIELMRPPAEVLQEEIAEV